MRKNPIYWVMVIALNVAELPLAIVRDVQTIYYRRKVRRQLGPDATPWQYGYASAPYMVKTMGSREKVVLFLAGSVLKGRAGEFHAGVSRWLRDNPPKP